MALGLVLTIGSKTFNLLDIGSYRNVASTPDQPEDLSIQSTIKADSASSFVVKSVKNVNSSTVGNPDEVSQAHVVFRWTPAVTRATLSAQFADLKTLLTDANIDAIMRGER